MNRSALVCVLACVAGVLPTAAEQPQFRGGSDAVRVFATVTDGDGRLVTTLTRNDFQIRDEGKPQPITLFDNRPQPIRLIVLLDVSGSMVGNLPLLRAASRQLLQRLLPEDAARIGTFGRDVSIGPEFTRDERALLSSLPQDVEPDAPTPLWRAVDEALTAFGEDDGGRRVILVLSDGKDSGPLGFRRRYVSPAEVIDRARASDVMIYSVGMRSRSGRPRMPGMGPGGLQAALTADLPDAGLALVAQETGGGYTEIRYGQDLAAAFEQVADELHSQYLLGFAPPKRDGKVHKIKVDVAPRGLEVRTRKSYVAPG